MPRTWIGMTAGQHAANFALFVIAAFFISEPPVVPELARHFFKALGEAFVIALVVIYLVESRSHMRMEHTAVKMIQKIGRNIFGVVYGHELPAKFVDALEETALSRPVYRETMTIHYELSSASLPRIDGKPDEEVCKLAAAYSFALVNCSDEPVTHGVRLFLERDKWLAKLLGDEAVDPVFEYVVVGDTLYVDAVSTAKIKARLKLPDGCDVEPLEKYLMRSDNGNTLTFKLKDVSIPPASPLRVDFSAIMTKRYSDNEVWSNGFPSLGAKLIASSSDFEVEARFPDNDSTATNRTELTSTWVYDRPMLVGQAVIVWWRPKGVPASVKAAV
jgi:hypothetical protein